MDNFVLETDRLILNYFSLDDAHIILELLEEPSFKEFIGDKGVRTIDDARDYLQKGPLESYARHGYGAYLTVEKKDNLSVGMCGLFKRDHMQYPDLGFAFFARACGKGYALESAQAVIQHSRQTLYLPILSAAADPANVKSVALIDKLGFQYQHSFRETDGETDLNYYEMSLQDG